MYFDIIDAFVNNITKTQPDVCIIAQFAYNLIILSPNLEPENMNTYVRYFLSPTPLQKWIQTTRNQNDTCLAQDS